MWQDKERGETRRADWVSKGAAGLDGELSAAMHRTQIQAQSAVTRPPCGLDTRGININRRAQVPQRLEP